MRHVTGAGSVLIARVLSHATAASFVLALLLFATPELGPVAGHEVSSWQAATHPTGGEAPTSGDLRLTFTTFLRSGAGIAATVLVYGALGVAAFAISYGSMSRTRHATPAKRPESHSTRRRLGSGRSDRSRNDDGLPRVLAAILAASCFLLPLVFTIALADVFAQPKSQLLWFIALVALTALVIAFMRGATPTRFGVIDIGLVGFVLLTVLATIFSINLNQSLKGERLQYQGLLSISSYVVLFVAARWSMRNDQRARVLSATLIASATLSAIYAIAQWFSLDPIWDALFKDRVFSTVGQANALGSILGMAGVSAIGLAGVGRRRLLVLAVALVLVGAAFVLTFSRGAYLGLPVGVAVAIAVLVANGMPASVRTFMPKFAAGLAAVALILVVGAAIWEPARGFFGRVVDRVTSIPNATESSNRSHLDLWEVGIRIASEHPILGTGPDTYVLLFPRYRDEVLTPDRAAVMAKFRPESAHNVYISTAAGSGLPSLVMYLFIIGGTLVAVFRVARREVPIEVRLALAGLAGAAVVHLVTDAFMTGEPSSAAVFWVLLGAGAGLAERHLDDGRPRPR